MELKDFLNLIMVPERVFLKLYWSGIYKGEWKVEDFLSSSSSEIYFDLDVGYFDIYGDYIEVWCR